MAKLLLVVVAVVAVIVAGGFAVLAVWDVPAPNAPIEKTIPDARFPK